MTFDRMIIHTTGFTQNLGARTGLEKLFLQVNHAFATKECYVLFPIRWKHAPWLIAEFVRRNLSHEGRLDCVCYSYGGGVWYPKFERLMQNAGRVIHSANLVDPVPRRQPLGWLGRLSDRWKVNVRNAQHCNAYFQKKDAPRSPGVVFHGERANYSQMTIPNSEHNLIDDDPAVHAAVLRSLE